MIEDRWETTESKGRMMKKGDVQRGDVCSWAQITLLTPASLLLQISVLGLIYFGHGSTNKSCCCVMHWWPKQKPWKFDQILLSHTYTFTNLALILLFSRLPWVVYFLQLRYGYGRFWLLLTVLFSLVMIFRSAKSDGRIEPRASFWGWLAGNEPQVMQKCLLRFWLVHVHVRVNMIERHMKGWPPILVWCSLNGNMRRSVSA